MLQEMLKYHPYLLLGGKYLECRQTDRCQTDRSLEWRKTDRCIGVEADRQMPSATEPQAL